MTFSVDVVALAGLPKLLDRVGDDARAGHVYLSKHTSLGAGEGLFNEVLGGHDRAVGKVSKFLDQVGSASRGQSNAVLAAIDRYTRTDLKAAAALDATMPSAPGASVRVEATGAVTFADRVEPQDCLVPPKEYAEYSFEMQLYEYVSPTSYARALLWEVTSLAARLGICDRPIDIFVEWLKPWLGDWDGFRACADVYENIGRASGGVSANLRAGVADSQVAWTGNAADGCRGTLNEAELAIGRADGELRELAAEYRSVATNTLKLAKSVAGMVVMAVDLAIVALVEIQAAVATSETVVGGLVFGAAAAHSIWKIFELASKISDAYKAAKYGTGLFCSAVDGFSVINPGSPLPVVKGATKSLD